MRIIGFGIFLIVISSCGLKYTPLPTEEDKGKERQTVIQNYLIQDASNNELRYESIAFAEPTYIKPPSFQVLDSLYKIKYKNELRGYIDPELEDKITVQRAIAQSDSLQVTTLENHVFAFLNDSIVIVNKAVFLLDDQNSILEVKINESNSFDPIYFEMYKIYLFEESFEYPGTVASYDERKFYEKFKREYHSRPLYEQNNFLIHTLMVMKLSKDEKPLSFEKLARIKLLQKDPDAKIIVKSTNKVKEEDGKVIYYLDLEINGKSALMSMDEFYEVIKME